jgi:hypothetical protein
MANALQQATFTFERGDDGRISRGVRQEALYRHSAFESDGTPNFRHASRAEQYVLPVRAAHRNYRCFQ